MKKKILIGLLLIIVVIQFFRIDKTNPELHWEDDFIEITNPPDDIVAILRSGCYDCHSSETNYPWYTNVAPVSWWVKDHINEGRDELNFSEWGTYKHKRKDHKLEEAVEMVEEGEMPLNEYTWTHAEAKLTKEQKTLLLDWLKEIRKEGKVADKNALHLNKGDKWKITLPINSAIQEMTTITAADVEEGRISHFVALGQRLEVKLVEIRETVVGDHEIDIMLQLYFDKLALQIGYLQQVETEGEALIVQKDVLKELNNYYNYFE